MKTLLTVLLFLAFYSLCISQKKEFANYAELKKGLPPDSSISDHFKYLDSNRILNAELKIDSATTVYFLIENKINGTKYYWLVLSPEAQSNIIRSIIPQNLTSKKIRFVEEFVLPEYKNILELEIDEEMEECFYNITKKIPLNFSLNVISNLLFEVLFSFYEQQTTYPYVSTPARGNKFEGISFSYSGKTKLYKTYQFEFRPAIIIQSYLMGFDLGFHIRKKIIEN
ncbi:MAG: hypothetical protein GYA14_00265, partial [Ignavibacteria bacterium]|nr:hypothetical protein [Ignavibacteria bacterium]